MEIFGYLAGILTAATMIPQVVKSIRTRHVRDVSLVMILLYAANSALWVVYGITIGATPLIIADTVAFALGLTQLFLKIRFGGPVSAP